MKHRQGLAAALLFCVMCTPVLMGAVAESEPETQDGETAQVETPPQPALYPIDIVLSEDDTAWRMKKVYQLDASADPSVIPTENFEQEGREYVFLDLLAEDQRETDTKEHTQQITQESSTKDTETVLKNLAPTLEYAGEDGYMGVLTLDTASVKVEASGYGRRNKNVTTTRTYPNLADADTSYIPKTVEENGCTMELVDVSWQTAAADEVSGQSVATRYTAVASYAGTKTSRYVKGYVVTADYVGNVSRTTNNSILYTALFSAMKEQEPEKDNTPYGALIGIPVAALAGGAGTAAGITAWRKYKKKKGIK